MINAKNELINLVGVNKLHTINGIFVKLKNIIFLYDKERDGALTASILEPLNINYDNDYGDQYLYGDIITEKENYIRYYHKGSEYWKIIKLPTLKDLYDKYEYSKMPSWYQIKQ